MHFSEEKKLVSKLRSKVKDGRLNDIDFKCKDGKVRGNRLLLSIYSDVLAELFEDNPIITCHPLFNVDSFGVNLPNFSRKEMSILNDVIISGDYLAVEDVDAKHVEAIAAFLGVHLQKGKANNGSVSFKAFIGSDCDDSDQSEDAFGDTFANGNNSQFSGRENVSVGGDASRSLDVRGPNVNSNCGVVRRCDIDLKNSPALHKAKTMRSGSDRSGPANDVNGLENESRSKDKEESVKVEDMGSENNEAPKLDEVNNCNNHDFSVVFSHESEDKNGCNNESSVEENSFLKRKDNRDEKCEEIIVNVEFDDSEYDDFYEDDFSQSEVMDVDNCDGLSLPSDFETDVTSTTVPLNSEETSADLSSEMSICNFCGMVFTNSHGLRIHKGRRHKSQMLKALTVKSDVTCKCGVKFPFNAKFRYFEHQKICDTIKKESCDDQTPKHSIKLELQTPKASIARNISTRQLKLVNPSTSTLVAGRSPTTCHLCNITCTTWRGLKSHMGHVHKHGLDSNQPKIKCVCGLILAFNAKSRLYEHRKTCDAFRKQAQICDLCDMPFETVYALKLHKNSAHGIASQKNMCACGVFCDNENQYRKHCIQCEVYRSGSWICDDCDLPFESNGSIKQHLLATNHRCLAFQENDELRNPNPDSVKFRSCKCGIRFSKNDREGYKTHRESCDEFMASAVLCDVCDGAFENYMCLKNHKFKAHGMLVGQNTCSCGETFSTTHQYRMHISDCEEYKSRALTCSRCNAYFATQNHLDRHVCKLSD